MKVTNEFDFIVVGAGVAGIRAAIELGGHGKVLCLAKREWNESNTQYAQGGIAAALSDEDEISLHLQDTLNAGDGLCNAEAARVLVEEGPASHRRADQVGHGIRSPGYQAGFHPRRRA